jgi:hypothetical protein
MSKTTEGVARTSLVRERADELGSFSMGDLANVLLKEGLWGNTSRIPAEFFRLGFSGAKDYVKTTLKREKMLNGACAWVALSSETGAIWQRWVNCTRREARAALVVLLEAANSSKKEFKKLKALHEERFHEEARVQGSSGSQTIEFIR